MFSTQRPHPLLWCERRKLDAKFPLNKCVLVYHHLLSLENERLFFQVILQHWEDFCSFDSLWLFPSVVIGSSCIYVKLFLACAWLPKLILFRSSLNRGKKKKHPPTPCLWSQIWFFMQMRDAKLKLPQISSLLFFLCQPIIHGIDYIYRDGYMLVIIREELERCNIGLYTIIIKPVPCCSVLWVSKQAQTWFSAALRVVVTSIKAEVWSVAKLDCGWLHSV